jgi:hypothetical protein
MGWRLIALFALGNARKFADAEFALLQEFAGGVLE